MAFCGAPKRACATKKIPWHTILRAPQNICRFCGARSSNAPLKANILWRTRGDAPQNKCGPHHQSLDFKFWGHFCGVCPKMRHRKVYFCGAFVSMRHRKYDGPTPMIGGKDILWHMGPHAPQNACFLWRTVVHVPQKVGILWRMWAHAPQNGFPRCTKGANPPSHYPFALLLPPPPSSSSSSLPSHFAHNFLHFL